jgi:hypothetical protein
VEDHEFTDDSDSSARLLGARIDYYYMDDGEQYIDYTINYQLSFCGYSSFRMEQILGTVFVIMVYGLFFMLAVLFLRGVERFVFYLTRGHIHIKLFANIYEIAK